MASHGPYCGSGHPDRAAWCDRPAGHGGSHSMGAGRPLQWGGAHGKGTYKKVKPLPADKPIAPHRAPAAPGHAKFRDTPGQGMLSMDDDDPERIDP